MSISHTIIRSYRDQSGNLITGSSTITDDTELNTSVVITAGATNHEVDWSATRANLQSLCLFTDQAITIKTNSSGSPTDTISMNANQEIAWGLAVDSLSRCPFSADVTKLYITNAGANNANVQIRAIAHQGN